MLPHSIDTCICLFISNYESMIICSPLSLSIYIYIYWKQHPTKQQLSSYLPPVKVRYAGHFRWSKKEFISNILPWTLTHGHTRVGRSAKTYIHPHCVDTGYWLEDLPRVMTDEERQRTRDRMERDRERETGWREREIRGGEMCVSKESLLASCLDHGGDV